MGRRIAIALIGLFLISLIPAGDFDINRVDDSTEALDRSVKRVEIAADPNSIQDLQSPTVSQGFERVRDNTADSIIGVYTESGLIPSVHLPNPLHSLARSRDGDCRWRCGNLGRSFRGGIISGSRNKNDHTSIWLLSSRNNRRTG